MNKYGICPDEDMYVLMCSVIVVTEREGEEEEDLSRHHLLHIITVLIKLAVVHLVM